MIVPIRRMFLTVGMVAMTATLLASCGGGGSSDDNASPTSNQQAVTTTGSPAQTGGGSATSNDTAKVRFINVWGGDPSGGTIDLYKATGVDTYSKVLSGLALGSASDWIDVDVEGYGSNFQVTKSGGKPNRDLFANNIQVSNLEKGQHGVNVIGWDPKAGPEQTGGTLFTNLNLATDDSVKSVDGKVTVHANLTSADADAAVFLSVVGKGCLGEDGLNEPTVQLDPGPIQIQGADGNTATGLCDGDVTVAPVSIDGKAGSTWVVALYGPASAQKLAAIDVTPS